MSSYQDYGFSDNLPAHTHSYLLNPILSLIKQKSAVLDLGCGNGWLANELLKKDYDSFGTDASPQGITLANKINPGRFFLQDLSSDDLPLELQNVTFKTIVSTEVIEHLYDPRTFISFARKILLNSGGGEIICQLPITVILKILLLP